MGEAEMIKPLQELETHQDTVRRLKAYHDGPAKQAMEDLLQYLHTLEMFLQVLEAMGESVDMTDEEKN